MAENVRTIQVRSSAIKANYFADDEFRKTVAEIVALVPDGYWITLIVEDPDDNSDEHGI